MMKSNGERQMLPQNRLFNLTSFPSRSEPKKRIYLSDAATSARSGVGANLKDKSASSKETGN